MKKPLYKENTIAKFFFSNENQKKVQMQDKKFEKSYKDYFQSFKTLLQNYTQKRNTEINQKILKKLLYNDNAIVKLHFSNDTGKNVPMKTFQK